MANKTPRRFNAIHALHAVLDIEHRAANRQPSIGTFHPTLHPTSASNLVNHHCLKKNKGALSPFLTTGRLANFFNGGMENFL